MTNEPLPNPLAAHPLRSSELALQQGACVALVEYGAMKDSEIYLRAAERLEVLCMGDGGRSPYCCDELRDFERQKDAFVWWFEPTEEELRLIVSVGWWGNPPMRWYGINEAAQEMHLQRTLALCFMAAIAKSEGR